MDNLIAYVAIAVFIIIFYFLFKSNRRYLLKNGTPAEAEVINIEKTIFESGSGSGAEPVMKITLRIDNLGKTDSQVTVRKTFGMGEIKPEPGDKVKVIFDPKNPKKLLLLRNRNDGLTYYS